MNTQDNITEEKAAQLIFELVYRIRIWDDEVDVVLSEWAESQNKDLISALNLAMNKLRPKEK